MRVFISHSRKDTKIAGELASKLSQANGGLDIWLAEKEVFPGDNWSLEVGKALQRSDALVVLLSPAAVASENVRHEINFALASPKFEGRVVSVIVKPTTGIPWILEKIQTIHSRGTDTKSLKKTAEKIVDSLLGSKRGDNLIQRMVGEPKVGN